MFDRNYLRRRGFLLASCFGLVLLAGAPALRAQTGGVLVTNTERTGTVWLKWLSETVYTEAPVNVYRREAGTAQWERLNDRPVDRLPAVPNLERDRAANERLVLAEQLVLELPFADQQEEMIQLFLLTELFGSNDFAEFLGLFYADTTALPGTTYEYRVAAVGPGGRETEIGTSDPLRVERWAGLAPPRGIRGTALENALALSWQPEELRYYSVNVYRDTFPTTADRPRVNDVPVVPARVPNPDGELVYPSFFYEADSLRNGTTYYLQLSAIDFFGRESTRSEPVAVVPVDRTPPDPVTDLRADRTGDRTVRLRWTRTFGADLVGYRIYRSSSFEVDELEPVSALLPPNRQRFEDVVPQYGDYLYFVGAEDSGGNSIPSNIGVVSVPDATPPQVPQALSATPGRGTIALRWSPSPEGDVLGYQVFRSLGDGRPTQFAALQADPIATPYFVDTLPRSAKNDFYYRVLAVDTSFNKSALSASVAAAMPDIIAPVAPTLRAARRSDAGVRLEWLASQSGDVAGQRIYRSTGADTTYRVLPPGDLAPTLTATLDAGVRPGSVYRYYLVAFDAAGNVSDASNVWTLRTPPEARPAADAAERLSGNYNRRDRSVKLKWRAGDSDVRGYVLYRRNTPAGRAVPVSGQLTAGQDEFVDQTVRPGQTYAYELRTYFPDGQVVRSAAVTVATNIQ